jgi:voltage-gated potassium channel
MTSVPKFLGGFIAVLVGFVVASTVAFMLTENLTPLQAFYFAVVTMATVGYGDISPKTGTGMILCVLIILAGVGTFSAGVGLITNAIFSRRDREAAKAKIELLSEVFMSTIAVGMLERFTAANPHAERLNAKFAALESWSEEEFEQASNELEAADFVIDPKAVDFSEWSSFLDSQSQVFLLLFSNPAISEGISLTKVLRRTYHLALAMRLAGRGSSTEEIARLRTDLEPIYRDLTLLWLHYVGRMMTQYRSAGQRLAATNPFKTRTT